MLNQNQENKRINTAEVILPAEVSHDEAATFPAVLPRAPLDTPVERFSKDLERREDNRKALLRWIQSNLVTGIDFGQIHVFGKDKCRLARDGRATECIDPRHWSKPSLWKPGAEKICGMLGLIPRFPNISEYETAALRGEDLKVIILKCELHTANGFVAAEGTGARRIAQDSGDINKSFKMAEKSSHIDATLRVAGLSELFTQDLEDMGIGVRGSVQSKTDEQTPPKSDQGQQKFASHTPAGGNQADAPANQPSANGQGSGGNRITGKQYKYIMDLMKEAGMDKRALNEHCRQTYGTVLDHITRGDASKLIDWLHNQ